MNVLSGSTLVMGRELRPMVRDPFTVIFSLVQPLILLALFGPLLTDVPGLGNGSVWDWFVPGVLAMITIFGTSMTGSNLLAELQQGSHERMLVTPLPRSALLVGRAFKEMVPLAAQAVLIVLVALPLGLSVNPIGAAVGIVLLGVFGVGLGALSYALALAVRGQDWVFWSIQQTLMFPLLILSGTMLPLTAAPGWMQFLVNINPLGYLVDAERALFAGDFASSTVMAGVVAAAATAAVGLAVGIRAMGSSRV
ncbi:MULTISPECIES: ABC transporter permease [Nocardiaceae]|uniref:ABC transporter permease n=1 Tax=Nocardiaceae TaxID=85025 RepID=UPI000B9BAFA8|nr:MULTISPECIES: ABC transporter permease [Rhodococcus]MDP9636451.1 ABC-2 type transport system permease protein [Rhodococcus cercidiphylli]MBY4011578.1 ABC transporter permease [Rhodococcus fascians]MBY4021333.1 ABC transporter permease [Rhodococcus fascians]MDQ0281022.1 ABC-2 type transport system permease protein [Rhodococcus fascians]OZC97038.1 multidrug ABC transporter permease [Rhodococcus sp. 06-221-2]